MEWSNNPEICKTCKELNISPSYVYPMDDILSWLHFDEQGRLHIHLDFSPGFRCNHNHEFYGRTTCPVHPCKYNGENE